MTLQILKSVRAILVGLGVSLSAIAAGCGDSDAAPAALKTYPVRGKVLLADGKPLASGVVVLVSPEKGMEFEGSLESDGTFQIRTAYGEGAPEGAYKVRIQADATKPGEARNKGRRGAAGLPYPPRYGDETTSELTAEVKPSDNELEPFTLVK